jgi:hypothetical protein
VRRLVNECLIEPGIRVHSKVRAGERHTDERGREQGSADLGDIVETILEGVAPNVEQGRAEEDDDQHSDSCTRPHEDPAR